MTDTKKLLNEAELDQVTGGKWNESFAMVLLLGEVNAKTVAKFCNVKENEVSVSIHLDDDTPNIFNIRGKNYTTDQLLKKVTNKEPF